jgi:hypothetical protein
MRLKVATDSVDFGSNINDIVVPEEMKKKFLSGLDFFDATIGGAGFTPSASMIFTGNRRHFTLANLKSPVTVALPQV